MTWDGGVQTGKRKLTILHHQIDETGAAPAPKVEGEPSDKPDKPDKPAEAAEPAVPAEPSPKAKSVGFDDDEEYEDADADEDGTEATEDLEEDDGPTYDEDDQVMITAAKSSIKGA